jgi:hypothetical protein
MDVQLIKARNECIGLVKELEKNKKTTGKKVASEAAKLEKLKKEAAVAAEAAKKEGSRRDKKNGTESSEKGRRRGNKEKEGSSS